jgi:hypothetical protein
MACILEKSTCVYAPPFFTNSRSQRMLLMNAKYMMVSSCEDKITEVSVVKCEVFEKLLEAKKGVCKTSF